MGAANVLPICPNYDRKLGQLEQSLQPLPCPFWSSTIVSLGRLFVSHMHIVTRRFPFTRWVHLSGDTVSRCSRIRTVSEFDRSDSR